MNLELSLKEFEEIRKREKVKMEEEVKFDYLISLSEEDEYVHKLYGGKVEISQNYLKQFGDFGKILKVYKYIPAFLLRVDPRLETEFKRFVGRLAEKKVIVDRNLLVSIPLPNREESSIGKSAEKLWNLEMVQAYKTQKELTKGSGEIVAVVDTGADYTHPEIESNFKKEKGYNVLNKSDDPFDDCYIPHGTHCCGIVAGKTVGVAPAVQLYAVKFLNEWGWGTLADAIEAIEWCIEKEVDITSNSWGSHSYSKALEMVFDKAWEKGIINVAAAGNSGDRRYHYPSCYESVISVPAVDKDAKRAWFSTMNEHNEIAAPGVKIYSCIRDGKYEEYSGTSMACPHVAGGAALVKAFNRGDAKRVRKNLGRWTKYLGPKEEYGYGLLQTYDATLYYY
jgi:subtilisin family serine protease